MNTVLPIIEPKLDTFKVMLKKGHKCRFCDLQVDAPGRHVRQCVPLLQAHVVQTTTELCLSKEQQSKSWRQSQSTPKPVASRSTATASTQKLTGFLRLSNHANHCYANSVLQGLWWQQPHLRRRGPLSAPFSRAMPSIINLQRSHVELDL